MKNLTHFKILFYSILVGLLAVIVCYSLMFFYDNASELPEALINYPGNLLAVIVLLPVAPSFYGGGFLILSFLGAFIYSLLIFYAIRHYYSGR